MPSAIVKTLYFDLDKLAWTLTAGGNALLQPLTIGQNDTIDFNVQFIKGGVAQTLTSPTFSAGIKVLNGFSNSYVVQFGAPTGTPPTYTFTGTISSTELSAALLTGVQFALEFRDSTNGIVTLPALTLNIAASYTITGTTPTSANGVLNVAAGKTATISNSITLTGTDGTTYNLATMGVSDGDKGDITVSNSGATWTIDAGVVTLAKMANIDATAGIKVLGRSTASSGVPEVLSTSGTGSVAMTHSPTFTGTIGGADINITGTILAGVCYGTGGMEIGPNSSYIFDDSTAANFLYLQATAGLFGSDKTQTLQNATGTVALTTDITGGTLAGSFTTLTGTSSATLGTNGGTGGSVVLRGSTSGSATINTSNTGVLALPSGTTATSMALTTPALGVATATSVQVGNGTSSVTSLQIGNNALNGFYSPSLVGTDIGVSANGTWVAFWNSSWGLVARLPIIPLSNNGTSCGTSGLRWSGVYSVLGDFSGAVVCGTTLAVTGATTLTGLLTANGGITLGDAQNIAFNTTTGTKIGAATTQKLSFWNATPIVQPTTAVASATVVHTGGGTNIKTDDTFDGYTIAQVVKALRNAGLLA
jgi:hypothetical protein